MNKEFFNPDDEFWKILREYGIKKEELRTDIELLNQIVINHIKELKVKSVAIRGGANTPAAEYFIRILKDCVNIEAVYDRKVQKKEILGIPVLHSDNIANTKADIILIVDVRVTYVLLNELSELFPEEKLYAIYPYFRNKCQLMGNVDLYKFEEDVDYSYYILNHMMMEYKKYPDINLLKDIALDFLIKKDFLYFKEYADLYIKQTKDENFIVLRDKIGNLISSIKEKFKERKNDGSIICHWIDQVPYEEQHFMPRVSKRMERGLSFQNAHTVSPYTTPAFKSVFEGEGYNIGKGDNRYSTGTDNKLNSLAKRENYVIYSNYIEREVLPLECCEGGHPDVCVTQLYWRTINRLINENNKILCLSHTLLETHNPFASPFMDDYEIHAFSFEQDYKKLDNRVKKGLEYADKQVDYYSDLFGESYIHIYMSDHGKWEDLYDRRYFDRSTHIFLGVVGPDISEKKENEIFSINQYVELVSWIIHRDDSHYRKMFKGYAPIADIRIWGSGFQYSFNKRMKKEGVYDKDALLAYTGVVTDTGRYVHFENGKDIFIKKGTNEEILINPPLEDKED